MSVEPISAKLFGEGDLQRLHREHWQLREALEMACREVAECRALHAGHYAVHESEVDDVVQEFIAKARGFPPEGSDGASP